MVRAALVIMVVGIQVLISSLGQAPAQQDLSALVAKTKDPVVQVTGYDADGKLTKTGNGVFITPEGHLLTHRALILGPAKLLIRTGANHDYPVKAVLADDKAKDLARLLVDPPGAPWPFMKVAAGDPPALGSRVLLVGYSKKMESTVVETMVSSVREFLGRRVIMISASVPVGADGGPVVNLKGELVGLAGSGISEGKPISFADPVPPEFLQKAGEPQAFGEWAAAHAAEALEAYLFFAAQSLRKGDKEWAVTYSQRALRLKPDSAQAQYSLGRAYLLAGKGEAAAKTLEALAKLDAKLADKLREDLKKTAKGAGEANLPELIQKAKPAVVLVQKLNKQGQARSFGSGFFINNQGHFITNYHVLGGATQARVKTLTGKTYPVIRVLAEDNAADLIMASIVPEVATPFLKVSGAIPQAGEKVITLGNPKGEEWTAADGIVSAVREKKWRGGVKKFVQISAPISPGSSGGPALNLQGEVIGVTTFHRLEAQNLNFASIGQNILDLKPGPGLTLEQRAEGWLAEAKDLVVQGRQAKTAKDLKKAASLFEEAKDKFSDLPDPYVELVVIYLMTNNQEAAKHELAALRGVNPQVAEALVKALNEAAAKEAKKSAKGIKKSRQ